MVRLLSVALVALLYGGCTPKTCHEAAKSGTPAMGDANGDGSVDLADGVYLQRYLLRGGPAPVCEGALDTIPDGSLDLADSQAIWTHAFTGNGAFPELTDGACEQRATVSDNLDCGHFTFALDAPKRAAGTADATVTLDSPDLEVEGWQIALEAEGCTIESGTLEGTRGADHADGGDRSTGYARVDPANKGIVSAVALGWLEEVVISPSPDPLPLLSVHVKKGGDCSCTLRFTDGLVGAGAPVRNEVVNKGRAWLPTTKEARIDLCG